MQLNNLSEIKIAAPGRICLFGDHQDYLGLPIIACSIDKYIYLRAKLNSTAKFKILMPDINKERIIDFNTELRPEGERDYFISSLKVLKRHGIEPNIGYDIVIKGEVPINAGLSSSSAIVVGWIQFLLQAYNGDKIISSDYVAKLAYEAEVLEYNSPGGLMDQYTIAIGNLLYLNTINGDYKIIDKDIKTLIIGESGVSKKTLGVLSELRSKAIDSISYVTKKVPKFRIVESNIEDYDLYKSLVPRELQPIFYAAIKNYEITKEALICFSEENLAIDLIGNLITEHHKILKNILKITVPRIDKMIDSALINGALGAKIVGSGGGGCIVALAKPKDEERVIKGMLEAGAVNAYKINISKGTVILKN